MAVIAIIFVNFMKGGFVQEKGLYRSLHEKTGEVPCFREPKLELPETSFVNVTKQLNNILSGSATVNFSAKANISSLCFEDLWVTWKIGNKIASTLCIYDHALGKYVNNNSRAEENCTYFNTSFTLNKDNLLNYLSSSVEVSVFGVRSGKYVEAKSKIFVPDPNFKITNITADYSDFPCVKLVFNYTSSLNSDVLSGRGISLRNFFVEDGGLREVEVFNSKLVSSESNSEEGTCEETGTKCYRYNNVPVVYRAPIKRDHKPELYFTIGGQAASNSTSFVVENPSKEGRKEFFVTIPNEGKIGVFNKSGQEIVSTPGKIYPLIKSDFFNNRLVDVAVGDLDEDGIAEVVVLLKPGDLVVFKYRKSDFEAMNNCYSQCKGKGDDFANCMSNCWPWYVNLDDIDWKEAQIDGDMIYLLSTGSTGDIFAYRYTPSGLVNVSHKDIPNHNYVDFA
ncbi:MAG: hypothetical protein ACP5KK_03240, partial [Candidatus Nanoarchaeia archaeon]